MNVILTEEDVEGKVVNLTTPGEINQNLTLSLVTLMTTTTKGKKF